MQTERPARSARAIAYAAIAAAFVFLLIAPALAAAAPENDDFAAAQPLPAVLPVSQFGSLLEATKEAGEPDHAGDPGGHSVWFSWTPERDGPAGLRGICFIGINPVIAVYTGATVGALEEVASNGELDTSNCFAGAPEIEFEAEAGTTYRIAVDGRGGEQGFFSLGFNQRPSNDEFASPVTIGADLPEALNGSTRFASKEADEPNHAGDPGGHSVWFSWTPATSGPVEISTCGGGPFSGLDTTLAVYTGTELDALTQIAANDDGPAPLESIGCPLNGSEVRFEATAGTTYRIAVDTPSDSGGGFALQLRGRPSNDAFATPRTIDDIPFATSAEAGNRLATKEPGEPNHAGNPGGASLWFSWTPTASGPFTISTCAERASELDTTLAVYTGASLGGLTEVAANDDAAERRCGFGDSAVELQAVAGTTYRIAVDAREGRGQFRLQIEPGPSNDDFADAATLRAGAPSGQLGSTRLATKEPGEPNHAGKPGGHSVWFSWTPSETGPVRISACRFLEEGPDVLLGVYTGNAVGSLTPVAASPTQDCRGDGSAVELQAVVGTTYRIAVDTVAGTAGFILDIGGRPPNDRFASPISIDPEPLQSAGETRLATKEPGEPNHAGDPGGHSIWFSWTPAKSGPVDVIACGRGGLDTLLGVYTGAAVGGLTEVAANDDSAPGVVGIGECSRRSSAVELQAVAGTTYRIAVDSRGEGAFSLAFQRTPGNDPFASPSTVATALPASASGSNRLATKEPGEPNHAGDPGGHSVWFKWTAKVSGPVQVSTCTFRSPLDTTLAVYTGTELDALTQIAANDDAGNGEECAPPDSSADFVAVAGNIYWIAIDGADDSTGNFQLLLDGVAAHDEFGKPQSLGGQASGFGFGSSRFATKQPGEPDHAGNPGGHSLWFKWTAPVTGPVSVDTCATRFDTLLGVYTGAAAAALTAVASNDDAGTRCGNRSRLSFDAVANTTYRIAVDGKAGAAGAVELRLDTRSRADTFAKAERIPGVLPLFTQQVSNHLATREPGEPNHAGDPGGHSVWFSWTPAKSSGVRLSACAGDFDPVLGIYTGATVDTLTPVAATAADVFCEAGTAVRFDAVANTTYRIAVDGRGGDSGRFELEFEPVPGAGDPPQPPLPPGLPRPPLPPGPPPTTLPLAPKPLKCKRGFAKKKVRGKVRCVKKKHKKPRRHRG